jgi:hypothetical protein
LVQDAIYNRLLTPARQELHERAAEAIERQGASNLSESIDDLADHYKKTARAEKTVHYMALAGAKSLQVYSLEEAEKRFRCVIDLIESVPTCADDTLLSDVLLKMARLYYYRGQFYNIISLVERYLPRVAAVGDKRRHSRLLFELGYSYSSKPERSPMGQTEKNSVRANVFRSSPKADMPAETHGNGLHSKSTITRIQSRPWSTDPTISPRPWRR